MQGLAFATPASAQETIKLKGGERVTGRATAYDAQKKVLSFRKSDGKEVQFSNDQLDMRSLYLVYASVIEDSNGKGQLQLANVARDAGLYKHAVRRYGIAEKADPSLKSQIDSELAILRDSAAKFCLKHATDAKAAGKTKDVEKWCAILLDKLPEQPEANIARAMLDETYVAERHAKDDALEEKHAELLKKDLQDGKRRYDRMIERTKEGLTATSSSQSTKLWDGAIEDGQFVLKELERIEKDYKDDAAVQEGVQKYTRLTIDQMVDVYMHLSSYYTTRTSYENARQSVNAALALDPKNAQVLAQRARIEQAVAEGRDRWN
jgi:hypothetical protein